MYIIIDSPRVLLTQFNKNNKAKPARKSIHASISNTFKMTEPVDKPSKFVPGWDIGVIPGVAFPAEKFYTGLDAERQYKNSNYYNPNSHNNRL